VYLGARPSLEEKPDLRLRALDQDCRAIGEHFGNALHELGRVVAGADDSVAAQFAGVSEHQIECFTARFFAKIGEQRDVAADQCLQSGANRPENGPGADDDSTYYAQGAHDAVSGKIKRGRHHVMTGRG